MTSNPPADPQSNATSALHGLEAQARDSAATIDAAFARAGESLSRSLAKAASDGKLSLKDLASALISAVDAAAGTSGGGLGSALSQILREAAHGFSGARADGGPVTAGGAYLVGERGPELFRPAVTGSIDAGIAPAVNVTLNVTAGAQGLVRSEAQIASAIARAARLGRS